MTAFVDTNAAWFAELIRRALGVVSGAEPGDDDKDDLWYSLAGVGAGSVSVEDGEIDEVVYGR